MKNQEQFPTIWDAPLKASTRPQPTGSVKKAAAPIKEAFLTIWDNAKRQPAV
ncbi:hypothetical protein P8S55_17010 [Halomonas sp. M1]|uniref:hypothetical protein n=1 Tax=Halomonas sp. M1 TaxID=3035470 RepID=UPI002486B672|nr:MULTISPECIES: hypothetical protein [unclassified Halomonas]MDP3535734.1 hypothetical protein [Halomonas sp.]WFE71464.1 hypothetical protein P8S55_17010 [Halomonas sp. M1]